MLMASGVTARALNRSFSPSSTRIRLALGDSCSPAPASSSRAALSRTTTRNPLAASASAAVSPPIPAPATTMVRVAATDGSGGFVLHHAFGRAGFAGAEVGGVAVQRRAIGTDDLVVVAEVEEHMRVIERRVGADAHELLRADLDDRDAGIVVKVRNDVIGHLIHLWSQWTREAIDKRRTVRTPRTLLAADRDSQSIQGCNLPMQIRHNLGVWEKPFFRRGSCVLKTAHHLKRSERPG